MQHINSCINHKGHSKLANKNIKIKNFGQTCTKLFYNHVLKTFIHIQSKNQFKCKFLPTLKLCLVHKALKWLNTYLIWVFTVHVVAEFHSLLFTILPTKKKNKQYTYTNKNSFGLSLSI